MLLILFNGVVLIKLFVGCCLIDGCLVCGCRWCIVGVWFVVWCIMVGFCWLLVVFFVLAIALSLLNQCILFFVEAFFFVWVGSLSCFFVLLTLLYNAGFQLIVH